MNTDPVIALAGLNEPQRDAVLHEGGPLVVFAGAGSGKTRVIVHRVAQLVTHVGLAPWNVLAVTFTNKAAGEMRERLDHMLPGGAARQLWVGTFHATCARLLRRHADEIGIRKDFVIYDDADQKAMITRVLRDLGLDDRRYPARTVAGRINKAKQEVRGPDAIEVEDAFTEVIRKIYVAYEERMAKASALDFGDLIYRLVVALEADPSLRSELEHRFRYVLVDEFQDTNHVQYRLVSALCSRHRQVTVVGDDDQSIYRWRGADRRNILDFRKQFPDARVVKLEQNYRSTQRILRAAYQVIRRNLDREPKRLWTENPEGSKVVVLRCEDERDEARLVVRAVAELRAAGRPLTEIAVFYRTHAQSRVLEEALRAQNIPYRVVGGLRFYDRAEIKDLLAYLRVLHNPSDDVSLLRIVNTPTRGVGKKTIERLMDEAARSGRGVYEALVDEAAASGKRLAEFVSLIEGLRGEVGKILLSELARQVIQRTGYEAWLREQDTPEADAKLQNVHELVGAMEQLEQEQPELGLGDFLEQVTLHTDADRGEGPSDRLTLMTVHAAKGLEFDAVLVTGLEDGMFPLRSSQPEVFEDPEEMEEERRLAYVALTRAREQLMLTWAVVRRVFGQIRPGRPSRFLTELPGEDVAWIGGAARGPQPSPPRWRGADHAAAQPPRMERGARD
ncbi:MAG: UvrD-helicase domain-containing protein, partial [Sandaracinaceae bacterium]|nr:UvrD-helicase domain-containing protein [Sandaracinaceae bacterium]